MIDDERICETVEKALKENVIDKETYIKAINIIKQAGNIDTREASQDDKAEVWNALKEMKTQADFIHLREWIIQKMIKTTSFI
jgi:hypothetical protein